MTKSQVGLSNVDNTSDATKDAATATLTNKTLTSPVITTPTGLVKGDVGLGNVDNTSDAAKPVSTSGQTALDLKLDDSQASAFGLSLLDDADATAGRGTLGLGTLATQDGIFSGTSSGINTGNQTLVGLGGVAAAGGTITSGTLALTTINTGTISGGTLTPVTVTASGNVTATGDVDATNVYAENNVNATNNVNTTNVNATNVTATGSFNGNGSALTDMTKSQVGLSNVDNTSDATKDAATATLTNKTLTSPVITTPTGLVKGDVGLGNVDNTSDAAKPVSTSGQTALDLKLDDSQASAFGLSLLDDADATAGRGTLGLGTLATQDGIFSGTSSGINTGNQTLVGLGGVAAAGGTITSGTLAGTTVNTGTISGGTIAPVTVNASGNTTLGDASGDAVTINAGTVNIPNAYFRRTKAGLAWRAAKMSTYSNLSLTVTSFGTAQVVTFVDGADGSVLEGPLSPSEWAGKTIKIGAVVAVNGTSAGNLRLRFNLNYLTAAELTGGNALSGMLSSARGTILGDSVTGSDYAAPTSATDPKLYESDSIVIPSTAAQIIVTFWAIRTNAGDTNTDNLYVQEIRVTEQ